jgi:hypothetical protein
MIDSIRIRRIWPLASFRFPSVCFSLTCARNLFVLGILLTATLLSAQAQPTQTASSTTPPSPRPAVRHKLTAQKVPAPAATPVPATPPAPETPNWPINGQAAPATIAWNRPELRIDATNSSLQQILTQVSAATGAEFQGLEKDERVFGAFGPGETRDILSQVLQGTGYNFVMVGDQGQGVPRQIILSARSASKPSQPGARPAAQEPEDDVVADYPQPEPQPQQQPPPVRAGFPPDVAMRGRLSPQMQQQIQQQQEQQGQAGQQPQQPQNQ